MVSGSSPGSKNGSFITSGAVMSGRVTVHKVPSPPLWNFSTSRKPPTSSPGASFRISVALLEACGEHRRQSGIADFLCRGGDVVGHPNIGQRVLHGVEQAVAGRRIAVARLTDGAQ